MKLINESTTFIANGISYNIPNMRNEISKNCEYLGLNVLEIVPSIFSNEGNDIKPEIKEEIKAKLPIAIFSDKNERITISINNNENQLNVVKSDNEARDNITVSKLFENLLKANVEKFTKLDDVVLIYTRNVKSQDKLKLLNEEIENIEDWNKNKTFILSIPFEYNDYTVTFKIQKLIPRDKDNTDRAYQISGAFVFDLTKVKSKQESLRKIIENYSEHKYSGLFIKKAAEFMSLKYE